jgi:hypothetical protein
VRRGLLAFLILLTGLLPSGTMAYGASERAVWLPSVRHLSAERAQSGAPQLPESVVSQPGGGSALPRTGIAVAPVALSGLALVLMGSGLWLLAGPSARPRRRRPA